MPSESAKTLCKGRPRRHHEFSWFSTSDKVMEGDYRILPGSFDAVQFIRSSWPHDDYLSS